MTASQVRWASQHDWFLSSSVIETEFAFGFMVTVRSDIPEWNTANIKFTDINKLKAWAGY